MMNLSTINNLLHDLLHVPVVEPDDSERDVIDAAGFSRFASGVDPVRRDWIGDVLYIEHAGRVA